MCGKNRAPVESGPCCQEFLLAERKGRSKMQKGFDFEDFTSPDNPLFWLTIWFTWPLVLLYWVFEGF